MPLVLVRTVSISNFLASFFLLMKSDSLIPLIVLYCQNLETALQIIPCGSPMVVMIFNQFFFLADSVTYCSVPCTTFTVCTCSVKRYRTWYVPVRSDFMPLKRKNKVDRWLCAVLIHRSTVAWTCMRLGLVWNLKPSQGALGRITCWGYGIHRTVVSGLVVEGENRQKGESRLGRWRRCRSKSKEVDGAIAAVVVAVKRDRWCRQFCCCRSSKKEMWSSRCWRWRWG